MLNFRKLGCAIALTASITAGIAGYAFWKSYASKPVQPQHTSQPEDSLSKHDLESKIRIASFNIQAFGKSKASKPEVMDIIKNIICLYDITAIQEIRNKKGDAVKSLMDLLNNDSDSYSLLISPRLGRKEPLESYAFVYKRRVIRLKRQAVVYPDPQDVFSREPYLAEFEAGNFDFVLANIHTSPKDARKEIQALQDVVRFAQSHYKGENDIIVLGDFNADNPGRHYFSESVTSGFRSSQYFWVVPDGADTTVKPTVFTYDRIVFLKKYTSPDYLGVWGVFDFKLKYGLSQKFAESVSDHFPVYAEFSTAVDDD